ncbi:MAG: rhomboid family intramembrane serine protease [Acidimicrobiales bacterium]
MDAVDSSGGPRGRPLSSLTLIGLIVAALVTVEAVDAFLLGDRLQARGIAPRRIDRLDGILWAPFLHDGWGHLASNAIPLSVLGWLASLRGRAYWVTVTVAAHLIGGALVWLLATGFNHIGASGVVFGYFGALLGGAWVDRRPAPLARALVAVLLYSTMIVGLVPQDDISWEGHLAGLVVGLAVARRLVEPPPAPADDGPLYPWEQDEPWRDG